MKNTITRTITAYKLTYATFDAKTLQLTPVATVLSDDEKPGYRTELKLKKEYNIPENAVLIRSDKVEEKRSITLEDFMKYSVPVSNDTESDD